MAENVNITPDMINNLVNMLKNSNTSSSDKNNEKDANTTDSSESRGIFSNFSSSSNGGLDFDTIMKIKSIMEVMNKKDDPNSKLLYSLKPYLRKSKQEKLDQYVNILKISQVTSLFNKPNKKEGDSK